MADHDTHLCLKHG